MSQASVIMAIVKGAKPDAKRIGVDLAEEWASRGDNLIRLNSGATSARKWSDKSKSNSLLTTAYTVEERIVSANTDSTRLPIKVTSESSSAGRRELQQKVTSPSTVEP